jgi:ribosomal protein S18 acetylase RimI-like enzyme
LSIFELVRSMADQAALIRPPDRVSRMRSMALEAGASAGLLRYLRRDAAANVYPLFQVLRRHQVRMWRLEAGARRVAAALVEGGQQLLPYVPDTWLVAEDGDSCARLLDLAMARQLSGTLTVSSRFGTLLSRGGLAATGVAEMHFISSRQPSGRGAADGRIVRLTRSILDGLTLSPSVLRLTGSARTFPEPSWYLAVVARQEVVAVLDAGVATPDAIAVQQMYVEPEWRRRGVATSLLGALGQCAAEKGRRLSYITDAANTAALAMVRRAGFELVDERITVRL